MSATMRAAIIACCAMGIGLLAVYLEVEDTRCGTRIQKLHQASDAALERIRRLEIRYNRLISPDLLERRLVEDMAAFESEGEGEGADAALELEPIYRRARVSESGG